MERTGHSSPNVDTYIEKDAVTPGGSSIVARANVLLILCPKTSNQEVFFYFKVCRIELGPNKAIEN